MLRSSVIILLFLFSSLSGFARLQGGAFIDSLVKRLPALKDDTVKCNVLHLISDRIKEIDPAQGIAYANEQKLLSEKLGYTRGIAMAYRDIGANYQYQANFTNALENYNQALNTLGNNKKDNDLYWHLIGHMAVVYQELGMYPKALEYHFKTLEYDKQKGEPYNLASSYGNIAIVYMEMKDYDKAMEFNLRSLSLFRTAGDTEGVAHTLGNIGNIYTARANYRQALDYDTKALNLFRETKNVRGVAINLGNIGEVYFFAAKQLVSGGDAGFLPSGNQKMFVDNAIYYLQQACDLSHSIGEMQNLLEFSQFLADAHQLSGDSTNAQRYRADFLRIRDSVYSLDKQSKLRDLQKASDTTVHKAATALGTLSTTNSYSTYYTIVAIGLVVIVVVIVIWLRIRAKQ